MKNLFICLSILLLASCAAKVDKEFTFEIPFEKSNNTETATYEETIEFCENISKASPWIHYDVLGQSAQGRDLPVLIVDKNGNFTSDKVKQTENAILLIQANIHPGEPDGNDAGMLLLRDIAITKEQEALLENLTIIFIPAFNADGLVRFGPYNRINQNGPKEMGWRTNAQNLNLNRDFLKADAPEMKAWLKFFNEWLPDFFIDCHVTDGADYQYIVTYGLETHGNMAEELTEWQKDTYLKTIEPQMFEAGFPMFPYVAFRRWHDPRSGLRSWVANPMLSEGYTAIQNRPGLLIETHMLKPFKDRVLATYQTIKLTAKLLNRENKNLRQLIQQADTYTASEDFRKIEFPITYKNSGDSVMVDFLGVEYDIIESDLTGGLWFQYYPDKPKSFQIPFFNHMIPDKSIKIPEAYIIPAEWNEVIDRLEIHGIEYSTLKKDTEIEVNSYKFTNINWGGGSYFADSGPREGRLPVNCRANPIIEKRPFPKGSVVVKTNQRTARVIAHIFEPEAPDSYLYWGFFNALFEQKEYAETYVMEVEARKMLKNNPKLQKEFEEFKKQNPELASNQWVVCNWFYEKSNWKDAKKEVYPVGKIFDNAILEKLETE